MPDHDNSNLIHRLSIDDKQIVLVGTAHVSRESVRLVEEVIAAESPDTVCVELCPSRYQSIRQKDQWRNMDIVKAIKEKKAFLLLAHLLMASFQKRIAKKLNVTPGEEMIRAMDVAEENGARVWLADRDVRVTLSRTWRLMGLRGKFKVLFQLIASLGDLDDIQEADVEKMKQEDILQSLLAEVDDTLPVLRSILIDERDQYLAQRIKAAPGPKIVAVLGAGHLQGVMQYLHETIDLQQLERLPPRGRLFSTLKWLIPIAIIVLLALGFWFGGLRTGGHMITWWVAVNGALAGLGALLAWAHPLTILSSVVAAPLTSLNPMIAAGWVSGLVEAFTRKPKVRDLEQLQEDILSIKGFWRNKITRILLVVVFTNLGSAVGTFVAIPLMVKLL